MSYVTETMAQRDNLYSYRPMPFYNDTNRPMRSFNKKLDLNLYCIKRPQQTCFIQVSNPNMLAWGIETGDILVVEKSNSLSVGDLVVIESDNQFMVYEFIAHDNGEFIFLPLDAKMKAIKTAQWTELPIIGVVTNTIHQIKPKKTMKFAA
ncbi:LexA family protein [Caviibacterium pharyngocola]|uniref:Type VI secretion protein ImpA n=1 Tax=Caviibacterium pharyngocola TaxID=28159 RepID=A0A2M8RYN9_9PAST|nr:S24 family peptidase [Caviibacterium pharyngocola]PJG84003.1 type VI secretion protein ImpA [Caviibacterium pharyngocola]